MYKKKVSVKVLVYLALLIGIDLILTRFFSYEIPGTSARIGLGFLPQVMAGYLFGPIGGMIMTGLSDFIGALLFPKGAFFIGYTITAMVRGLIYGLILHKCPINTKELIIKSTLAVLMIVSVDIFLNAFWDTMIFIPSYSGALFRKFASVSLYVNVTVKLIMIPVFIKMVSKIPVISKIDL